MCFLWPRAKEKMLEGCPWLYPILFCSPWEAIRLAFKAAGSGQRNPAEARRHLKLLVRVRCISSCQESRKERAPKRERRISNTWEAQRTVIHDGKPTPYPLSSFRVKIRELQSGGGGEDRGSLNSHYANYSLLEHNSYKLREGIWLTYQIQSFDHYMKMDILVIDLFLHLNEHSNF